jgi:hypothetical protein
MDIFHDLFPDVIQNIIVAYSPVDRGSAWMCLDEKTRHKTIIKTFYYYDRETVEKSLQFLGCLQQYGDTESFDLYFTVSTWINNSSDVSFSTIIKSSYWYLTKPSNLPLSSRYRINYLRLVHGREDYIISVWKEIMESDWCDGSAKKLWEEILSISGEFSFT